MTSLRPDEIMAESFRIIDAEIGAHAFGPLEWPIVRRMIHASGDIALAASIRFSATAAAAGIDAFQTGVPIVTDVRMVAAGIQRPLCKALGVEVHCFLDDPETESATSGQTRCARSMDRAVRLHPQAVFVVGNAPTALSALAAAVRQDIARPRLVLAMPVGFVGVLESKREALALPVPVIAIQGRRGGSALAAAAVNALLVLARETPP